MVRERQLDEDPVDRVVGVQLGDEPQELVLGRLGGQVVVVRLDPRLAARLVLLADVDLRRRVVADEHGGEADRAELGDLGGDLLANPRRERRAVHLHRGHAGKTSFRPFRARGLAVPGARREGETAVLVRKPPPPMPEAPLEEPPPDRDLWPWLVVLVALVIAGNRRRLVRHARREYPDGHADGDDRSLRFRSTRRSRPWSRRPSRSSSGSRHRPRCARSRRQA